MNKLKFKKIVFALVPALIIGFSAFKGGNPTPT